MRTISWSFAFLAMTASSQSPTPQASPRLVYSTYAGSESASAVTALTVDSSGYVYVGGLAVSGGGLDCNFVRKLNQSGTGIVWSVCLPVLISGIAVNAAGYVYVPGFRLTPDGQPSSFPTQLVSNVTGIALDRSGNVYLAGFAGPNFKPTSGAVSASGGGFVAKLTAAGTLAYAARIDVTALSNTHVHGPNIAVDSNGRVWVVGASCGCDPDLPGCIQTMLPNGACVYGTASTIRLLDADGSKVLVSRTFGGGSGTRPTSYELDDAALGVAVDSSDSAWIVGSAHTLRVPTTPDALEPLQMGGAFPFSTPLARIGYALKFSASGALVYGTYIGSALRDNSDAIPSVAVDRDGRPYFALNLATNFEGCQPPRATLMALGADGKSVVSSWDFTNPVQAVASDGKGGFYAAGTARTLWFLATADAYEPVYPGGSNSGYVAKFDLTQPGPQFSCMANAASFSEISVAPGEIVTLVGKGFPPSPKVTFDGFAAPILYAAPNQINAVAPFEVSGPTTVAAVEGSSAFILPVLPALPGLFTSGASGSGQAAALNQDGTVNSNTNPAKPGLVVSVYMTGFGALMPPIADGQIGPLQAPFPVPVLGVSATINGAGAPVLFAGQAPGLIAGAIQVNVQIPPGTASGNAALVVYVGNWRSQLSMTTIAVQ